MALTRAQLLMGDSSQGAVLTGQVQGVKSGAGIAIAADGTISVDSQTVIGLMKLGQTPALAAAAYNSYNWPTSTGTVGQQLTISGIAAGVTTLAWDDPDLIPWTAKGQLVVGTGVNTQTLLNVGADGSILVADSAAASGLNYTSNYVATTGSTGAANIPAGAQGLRPATPATGAFRYNSTNTSLEFYNGTSWETVASSTTNSFVEQTSTTGSAVMPAGTTLQRDGSPSGGYTRFNDDTDRLEYWDGTSWETVASSTTGSFVSQTVPTTGSPSAEIPTGTTANRQTVPAPAAGYLRFNTTTALLEVYDGTSWVSSGGASVTTFSAGTTGFTPVAATSGAVTLAGALNIANGGTGATTATAAINALLPSQGGNAGEFLTTDGTNVSWAPGGGGVTQIVAGTNVTISPAGGTGVVTINATGGGGGGGVTAVTATAPLASSGGTTPDISLSGTIPIANGGTGATTATAAINALLPSQGGNAGEFLTTDGTNVSWAAVSGGVSFLGVGTTVMASPTLSPPFSGGPLASTDLIGLGVGTDGNGDILGGGNNIFIFSGGGTGGSWQRTGYGYVTTAGPYDFYIFSTWQRIA